MKRHTSLGDRMKGSISESGATTWRKRGYIWLRGSSDTLMNTLWFHDARRFEGVYRDFNRGVD